MKCPFCVSCKASVWRIIATAAFNQSLLSWLIVQTVWPDVRVKSSPIFQKLPQKLPMQFLHKSEDFWKSAKCCQSFGLLLLDFFAKNFQKSPNLVTLRPNVILPSHLLPSSGMSLLRFSRLPPVSNGPNVLWCSNGPPRLSICHQRAVHKWKIS